MFDSTVLTRLRPGENTTSLNFVRGKRERERERLRDFLNGHTCVGVGHAQRANTHKGFNC